MLPLVNFSNAAPANIAETLPVSLFAPAEPTLFGAHVTHLKLGALARAITTQPPRSGEGARCIYTMNVFHVSVLQKNHAFRKAYARAWAVTIDGAPVSAMAKLIGLRRDRITGADLMPVVVRSLSPVRHRPFFVVSDQETEDRLRSLLLADGFSADQVGFARPAFGFEQDHQASEELARAIFAHGATHLFMSVGAPKSEIWVHEHRHALGDLYAMCFGAGANFLAGTSRRAPAFMRTYGLEWLYRLCTEPKRLWRRYTVESWGFFAASLRELIIASRRHA